MPKPELNPLQKSMLREFAFRPLDSAHFCSGKRNVTLAPKVAQTHINVLARAGYVEETQARHFAITRAGRLLLDNYDLARTQTLARYGNTTTSASYTGLNMPCPRANAGQLSLNGRGV